MESTDPLDYVILHTFIDKPERENDLAPAFKVLSKINGPILHWRCDGPTGYYEGLASVWHRTIINIEQDIVPSYDGIMELLTCPEPFCTFLYHLPKRTYRRALSVWTIETIEEANIGPVDRFYRKISSVPDFVSGSSIGFCKIDGTAFDIEFYDKHAYTWWWLDGWISREMFKRGLKWHVHKKIVEHLHL